LVTKVQFFSVLVFLNKKNKVSALNRSQNRSDLIDKVFKFNTFLLNFSLYAFQLTYQLFQYFLLLLQKQFLWLYFLFLLFSQVQRLLQFFVPLISFFLLILAEQMVLLRSTPHHVPMQGWQTQVYNLAEVFINCVDSLLSRRSDLVPKIVNYWVYFFVFLLQGKILILEHALQIFDQLMPAGCKPTHGFILIDNSVKVVFCFLQLFFSAEQFFCEAFLFFFKHFDVKFLSVPWKFCRLFVSLFFIKCWSGLIILGVIQWGSSIILVDRDLFDEWGRRVRLFFVQGRLNFFSEVFGSYLGGDGFNFISILVFLKRNTWNSTVFQEVFSWEYILLKGCIFLIDLRVFLFFLRQVSRNVKIIGIRIIRVLLHFRTDTKIYYESVFVSIMKEAQNFYVYCFGTSLESILTFCFENIIIDK
jgi:hypothetical protein